MTQISRWDALKDPLGIVDGFSLHAGDWQGAHLVLAGPGGESVADDPEAAQVLAAVTAARDRLAPEVRARVHLVSLPMDDADENAAMVNALQRRAAVVVQKSLAEGFGLTVTEAMWKGRPIVAGASAASRTRSTTASRACSWTRATSTASGRRSPGCSATRRERSAWAAPRTIVRSPSTSRRATCASGRRSSARTDPLR